MEEALIGPVTEAVLGYLLEQAGLGEKVRALLKREPERLAFKLAFGHACVAFSDRHQQWAIVLLNESFLTGPARPLLARCLLRDGPPPGAELANAWADHTGLSADRRADWLPTAITVADDFLAILDRELRAREELQALFDSRALDDIADATVQTAETTVQMLALMRAQHDELRALRAQLARIHSPPQPPALPDPDITVQPAPPAVLAAPQRQGDNPFVAGGAVAPELFYGRRDQRMSVRDRVGGAAPQCISIVGFRRSGKSSLLRYVAERIDEFCAPERRPLVVSLSLADKRFQTPEGVTEGLRRAIERDTGRPPWRREDNGDAWAVDDGLCDLRDSGRRLIVLLDEFEQIGARLETFAGWGADWREKASTQGYCALVLATLRPIDAVYGDLGLTSPFGNIFTVAELGALAPDEWHALVRDGFARSGDAVGAADLALLDDLAGGLPFYTQLAAQLLWRYADHARTRAEFARQARPRFDELWRDLRAPERQALRQAAGLPGPAAPAATQADLRRLGLLRDDGRPFSAALAEYLPELR